jgi:putative flavoprotein involved in K+ transport
VAATHEEPSVPTTHTIVIGAGQAGLAMSRCLTDVGIDHVVLERGRPAERWRSQRWDSLRLLTPNWATRLPGWTYRGPQPDGYMTATELADHLAAYARSFDAPVHEGKAVRAVERAGTGLVVRTDDEAWSAENVVVATGWCDEPRVPALGVTLDARIAQVTPYSYRNPEQLPEGRVLIVGASATGVQIADELARAGREVVLAVGRHSRVPRSYRGMDIWWWLEQIGTFARTIDQVADPVRARGEGSLQLTGRPDRRDVDLPALQALGVRLAGHLVDSDGRRMRFADDLAATTAAADTRLERILAQIDRHAAAVALDAELLPATVPAPIAPTEAIRRLDLRRQQVTTVVWATGFTRSYPWLRVPVLDARGEIAQRRGVTPERGVYVLGQRFQHRLDSNFIDGVRHDAAYVAGHIVARRRGVLPVPRPTPDQRMFDDHHPTSTLP